MNRQSRRSATLIGGLLLAHAGWAQSFVVPSNLGFEVCGDGPHSLMPADFTLVELGWPSWFPFRPMVLGAGAAYAGRFIVPPQPASGSFTVSITAAGGPGASVATLSPCRLSFGPTAPACRTEVGSEVVLQWDNRPNAVWACQLIPGQMYYWNFTQGSATTPVAGEPFCAQCVIDYRWSTTFH